MAEVMSGCIKPYMIAKEIENHGAQTTLETARAAIISEVGVKLPFPCPQCQTTGLINSGTKECPTCYGWGQTETLQSVATKTFTQNTNPPQPTLS